MAMEIPVLNKYFDDVIEVKDARLRDQCTMECEFCDCTCNIKLPGKSLANELNINKIKEEEEQLGGDDDDNGFLDIGRIQLNRKKQKEGLEGLKSLSADNSNGGNNSKIKPIFAGAAISGLFAIFFDCKDKDYFRVKNIPDTTEARQLLESIELNVDYDVDSIKANALTSLAKSDKRSNIT